MPSDELRDMLRQQPFIPFRIHLSDGRLFDVRHREMVWVGRHVAVMGIFGPDGYLDRHETIALVHVVSLEASQNTTQVG
jgi:hypothetical protein